MFLDTAAWGEGGEIQWSEFALSIHGPTEEAPTRKQKGNGLRGNTYHHSALLDLESGELGGISGVSDGLVGRLDRNEEQFDFSHGPFWEI